MQRRKLVPKWARGRTASVARCQYSSHSADRYVNHAWTITRIDNRSSIAIARPDMQDLEGIDKYNTLLQRVLVRVA